MMLKYVLYPAVLIVTVACGGNTPAEKEAPGDTPVPAGKKEKTIGAIALPAGYSRMPAAAGTFAAWLRQVPLKEDKTVYLYNGMPKANQSAQYAVIDIPVGKKDLQQCADAAMRLRAEYLFIEKKYGEIAFMDFNGKWYTWKGGNNRTAFEIYLQTVFGWCGSASLEKQLKPVSDFNDIQTGDVLITGGFPGHAMTVVDMAVNTKGEKIFLLAQGYQPAQDIHVLLNHEENTISPWYRIPIENILYTPEWFFYKKNLRRW